jgi:hypothetical protein
MPTKDVARCDVEETKEQTKQIELLQTNVPSHIPKYLRNP